MTLCLGFFLVVFLVVFLVNFMKFLLTYFSSLSGLLLSSNPILQACWPLLFQFPGCSVRIPFTRCSVLRKAVHYSHCLVVEETPLLAAMTWQEISVCANLHMYMCVHTHTQPSQSCKKWNLWNSLYSGGLQLCCIFISRISCSRSKRTLHFKTHFLA